MGKNPFIFFILIPFSVANYFIFEFQKNYNDKVGDTDNDYKLTFSPESDGKWNTSTDKNEIPTQGIMTLTV